MLNKKGMTFIEVAIAIGIIALALFAICMFGVQVKHRTVFEDNKSFAFYTNVSTLELIQKELNNTGDIKYAVGTASEQVKSKNRNHHITLIVKASPVILYPPGTDVISELDNKATPVDENKDGTADYFINGDTIYSESGIFDAKQDYSRITGLYKVEINTMVDAKKWEDAKIEALIMPNKGVNNYV